MFLVQCASACSGNLTFPVAAVSENGYGKIMNITINAVPGNGRIFLEVPPYSAADLQQSVVKAVRYANDAGCDVYVTFGDSHEEGYIEGPSASAAIASMTYILGHNLSVVNTPVITGALGSSGVVLPVGGIYEKATASAVNGVPAFVSPGVSVYDYIMLNKLKERYGTNIVVVGSIDEIVAYISENKTPSAPDYPVFKPDAENISRYEEITVQTEFAPIASKMVERENYTLQQLKKVDGEEWIINYFNSSVNENARILAHGYPYTAANNAFLAYVDLSTILFVYRGEQAYTEKKDEIEECLKSIERPALNSENFEWVIGSDLRKAWAENKINSAAIEKTHLVEEEYVYYHEIMYADGWCAAAKDFSNVGAGRDGKVMNETVWKELAANYMARANKTSHSAETEERFNTAKRLFAEGRYGGAIFDSVYVIAMDTANEELSKMDEEEIKLSIDRMLAQHFSSLWANVYRSQAVYLLRKDEPNYNTAYSLLLYSSYLENAVNAMKEKETEQAIGSAPIGPEQTAEFWSNPGSFLFFVTFILLFLILVYILPRMMNRFVRRSDERKDSTVDRNNGRARKHRYKGRVSKGEGK